VNTRAVSAGSCAALCLLAFAVPLARAGSAGPTTDPLAVEIARWSAFLKSNTSTDEMWTQVKEAGVPALERTGKALHDGRRLLALQRLAAVRVDLAASDFLERRPPDERKDDAGFEAEWARLGKALRSDLGVPSPGALDGVRPAAVRAIGESVLPQVRVYYEASLEYGRNTMPDAGLFYLGAAQAQKEFAAFCRSLSATTPGRAPKLRSLKGEIDALQHDLLAVYRPPVSIDRHLEFIVASSTLKEARELDTAGLRHGALLRYLEAALRFAPLREAPPPLDPEAIAARLRELDARLSAEAVDHSIGRLFLESAQANLEDSVAGTGPAIAAAIAMEVLPRYFAALEPARPETPKPAPRATVTLVRWPYT
jgi:hypothetical protein